MSKKKSPQPGGAFDIARWTVTRILLHAKKWRGPVDALPDNAEIKITRDDVTIYLNAGEWVQHASDGAVGEVVSEWASQGEAEEDAIRRARDTNEEHRVCLAVGD